MTLFNNSSVFMTSLPSTNSTNTHEFWFKQIFPMIIFVFGAIGNTLTLFVLRDKKYSQISTCYFMKALALSDNFVMLLLLIRWLNKLPYNIIEHDDNFCRFYFFFIRLGLGISAWALMFMTIDRYISIRFPLKAKYLCSIQKTKIQLIVIILVHIITHLPYFWRYSNKDASTLSGTCPYDLPQEFAVIYQIIRIAAFDRILPWLITLGFSIAILVQLYKGNRAGRLNATNVTERKINARRVTTMSLSVAWTFFILTFPTSIYETVRILANKRLSLSPFLYELFVYLLYLNSAINFYLYLIVAHKFREDFKRCLSIRSNRVRNRDGMNDTTSPQHPKGTTSTAAISNGTFDRTISVF